MKSKIKELASSRATFYRDIKIIDEALTPFGETFFRKIDDKGREAYTLNRELLKYHLSESVDSIFNLGALIKLGTLLDTTGIEYDLSEVKAMANINGKAKELEKKFYNLSRLQSNHTQDSYKKVINALLKNHILSFTYNQKRYSKVFPLSLVQYRDGLYLIGMKNEINAEAIRLFKMARFNEVTVTKGCFTYPLSWSPEAYFKDSSGIIVGSELKACIRVYGESRLHIREREFFGKELLSHEVEYDEYELTYSKDDELLGQLFVYAQDVEIIAPQELKESFIKKARLAIALNTSMLSAGLCK